MLFNDHHPRTSVTLYLREGMATCVIVNEFSSAGSFARLLSRYYRRVKYFLANYFRYFGLSLLPVRQRILVFRFPSAR